MLEGCGDQVFPALLCAVICRRADGCIIRLTSAGGEDDLTRIGGAEAFCHAGAGVLQVHLGFLPDRMQAGGVSVLIFQCPYHFFESRRAHGCGGGVIGIHVPDVFCVLHTVIPLCCISLCPAGGCCRCICRGFSLCFPFCAAIIAHNSYLVNRILEISFGGGGLPFFSPANPAFGLLSCPPSPKGKDIPPPPFPSGEGGDQGFFHARGFAPCIPGAEPGRHWLSLRGRRPAGACPVWGGASPPAPLHLSRGRHWLKLALLVPGGGLCPEPPDVPAGHRADRTVSPLIPV